MGLNQSSWKEATFKASSKNKSKNLDDEEALFIKKLEKGTRKYKGKLPLKWFNCGRIGHFDSKCTYPKQDDSDERETSKFKKGKTRNKKKSYEKKKIVYSMEDSEDEETEILFMGVDTQASNSDSNVEGEVDLRVELVSALEEREKCRKKEQSIKPCHL